MNDPLAIQVDQEPRLPARAAETGRHAAGAHHPDWVLWGWLARRFRHVVAASQGIQGT